MKRRGIFDDFDVKKSTMTEEQFRQQHHACKLETTNSFVICADCQTIFMRGEDGIELCQGSWRAGWDTPTD